MGTLAVSVAVLQWLLIPQPFSLDAVMSSTQQKQDFPKAYDHRPVEERLYRFWMEQGYFTPAIQPDKKPFVIIMPPPNVTGELHLGHAITAALEDAMTRWHRMRGEPTLWLPGSDHAGIATQVVVERALAQEGLTRHQLGREKFVERVWEWVRKYGSIITQQHQRLGASCDWTREQFTLNPGPSLAVRTTFVNLHNKGLIYRGERIINWCPRCATALSDLEVDHTQEQGSLYYIRYPFESGGHLTVATTRPETLLGDSAVAVNPQDPRYGSAIGKLVILPVLGRPIPVIADEAVDSSFGTGALKVTPGHDATDFEIGQRHGLPVVNVMNLDATLNENAGHYKGWERFEARKAIVEQLEREGLLEKVEPYALALSRCNRCDTAVEPLVSKQWFVRMKPLAAPAIQAVEDGRIRIIPQRFTRVYMGWMENIRDWCISRQLWWGHRIPVWYCTHCDGDKITLVLSGIRISGAITDTPLDERFKQTKPRSVDTLQGFLKDGIALQEIDSRIETSNIGMDVTPIVGLGPPSHCPKCGGHELFQDPDVLDTWFSSGLWTHSTLGWPQDTEDQRYFYPTSVMETGYDILFFWVARMIMMGMENTGQVPFHTVYLHGLIRDAHGAKMSKSRGNVIDPLKTIEMYGADALRFAITTGTTPGNDSRLSQDKLEAARNFANKLWNATRYVTTTLEGADNLQGWSALPTPSHREDRWILSRHHRLTGRVNQLLADFQFGEAERELYDFLWGEFCDWYIEMAKVRLRQGDTAPLPVLAYVLERTLRLLHPFMPFITEELWQRLTQALPKEGGLPNSVMVAPYPEADEQMLDSAAEDEVDLVRGIVQAIRNIRAEFKIEPRQALEAVVAAPLTSVIAEEAEVIRSLARVEPLRILDQGAPPPSSHQTVTLVVGKATVYLPLGDAVDLASERQRLQKEMASTQVATGRLEQRLADQQFLSKAPEDVVEKERERLASAQERLARIRELLGQLGG
ncbi:MAG: valine--tRNA ligase [Dehalococcoidia bacterium]|nr:valine--tRNA ligase [Dehalococcoidia bacterium]